MSCQPFENILRLVFRIQTITLYVIRVVLFSKVFINRSNITIFISERLTNSVRKFAEKSRLPIEITDKENCGQGGENIFSMALHMC